MPPGGTKRVQHRSLAMSMNSPASLPPTMRAIAFAAAGGPEVLRVEQLPAPRPAAGEVLIRVAYAGVNRPDLLQRAGLYPAPPGASPLLGLEVAGEVVACGEGSGWQLGDRVCALTPGGGYAEYALAPGAHCLPLPAGLSLREAACLPETCFTVWTNVVERAALRAGETFLVHGGASGIGVTAMQIARNLGAHVFATAGGAAKAEFCRSLGATRVVDYTAEDFVPLLRAEAEGLTGRRGVDVILDMVGGDYVARNIACLAPDGRLVNIAFLRGSQVSVDLMPVMMKRLTLSGSTLRARTDADKARIAAGVRERVWPWLADGRMRVAVDSEFPLEQAAEAHRRMAGNAHLGKIVLAVAGER